MLRNFMSSSGPPRLCTVPYRSSTSRSSSTNIRCSYRTKRGTSLRCLTMSRLAPILGLLYLTLFALVAMTVVTEVAAAPVSSSATADLDVTQKHSNALIEWVRSKKGGYFNPKVEMRRVDPLDPSSHFGMFAKEAIPKGSLLLRVPKEMVLDSREEDPEITAMVCGLVENLAEQLRLGNKSDYAPYVDYLLETQFPSRLPSAWSKAGKELLMQVLGHDDFSYDEAMDYWNEHGDLGLENTLPPVDPIGWIEHEWYRDCEGSRDEMDEFAALLVVQRAWDDVLVPMYDLMSHRNGKWLNTESNEDGVHGDRPVVVQAKRDIEAGEEIYSSYNMCEDCGARITSYGTSEILRDYGFVEQYPQSWFFHDVDIGFRIDEGGLDADGNQVYVLTEWVGADESENEDDDDDDGNEQQPDEEDVQELKYKLDQVKESIETYLQDREEYPLVPDSEWNTIQHYMSCMELALEVALDWAEQMNPADETICVEEGTCTVSLNRYRDLDIPYQTENERYYSAMTCDVNAQFRKFDDGTYVEIDSFKSQYQQINFFWNPRDRDTCMDLDNTVQICDAYRPHYHEYAVHQTARFMPENSIKRVLFVGGGDSMLLHETLKYPSLELVVGLELDQKVTRGCFKHFGTQPHFHDSRVQWWFGDASKSLLMLPKDYFASFDLVLVDLSETVMSFKVTEELDVLEALTLLVKPEGIFVKNEVYFEEFKDMFPYSAQVHWYDNPIICAQVMVMGSRTIDFMNPILTDHGIKNLVVKELRDIQDNFELYHDYAFNATSHHLCDSLAGKTKESSTEQTRSPGIIMVVEAEDVNGDISGAALKNSIPTSLANKGFHVISTDVVEADGKAILYVILSEGYVVARSVIDSKYVGFDIHLWSSMHKQDEAKHALVATVGGRSSALSTFRVIAGGMFGVSTWMNDEKLRGPQFEEMCESIKATAPQVKESERDNINKGDIHMAMEQALNVIQSKSLKVGLLVGSKDDGHSSQSSRAVLEGFDSVDEVVTFTCPSMAEFNEFSEEAGSALTACEKFLLEEILTTSETMKLNAIVIDPTADKFTASIFLKVFSARRETLLSQALEDDAIIISVVIDNDSDFWKKNLMLLFKDDVFIESPTAFADILIENSENKSGFHLLITNYGDEHFIGNLNSTLSSLNNDTSNTLSGAVQVIHGGEWLYQENFEPSRSFLPDDYDQTEPLAQWKSQKPVGHQIILQMEHNPDSPKKEVEITPSVLHRALETAMKDSDLPGINTGTIQQYSDLGEGSILATIWPGGSVLVLWDGRNHIDINIFTHVEDIRIGDDFEASFLRIIPSFATILRDEQPRGMGNVVSYLRDLEGNLEPHWS